MTQTYSDPTYTKLISQGDELVKRIKQGLDSEHYATWAREGTWAVKMTLLKCGYAFDVLIHDDAPSIRRQVMEKDPSYMKYNHILKTWF